jgi:uncharacterized protein involved in response to NO
MSRLLQLTEPGQRPLAGPPATPEGLSLLRLAFRPFYLLGTAAAALLPLLWVLSLAGVLGLDSALPPPLWHGHEMLFGVVVAVIVGFLFTAGRTWTGLPTPTGPFLATLALLWLAARVAGLWAPVAVFVVLDLAFLPLVAALFADLLVRAGNRRNAPIAAVLLLLATANAAFHAGNLSALPVDPHAALQAAVLLVVAVMSIIGGRVIPAFIGNAVPGSRPQVHGGLERWGLPLTALALLAWLAAPSHGLTTALLAVLALWHGLRLLLWRPWVARGRPILWILPAAYAWIPLGLALLSAASAGLVPASMGLHALTSGAMGALIVGMVSRTSRGHTGRPLVAGMRERWAYALVLGGAALRVAAPLLPGPAHLATLLAAALAWSVAFGLLFVTLVPWLTATRVDGRAG